MPRVTTSGLPVVIMVGVIGFLGCAHMAPRSSHLYRFQPPILDLFGKH